MISPLIKKKKIKYGFPEFKAVHIKRECWNILYCIHTLNDLDQNIIKFKCIRYMQLLKNIFHGLYQTDIFTTVTMQL